MVETPVGQFLQQCGKTPWKPKPGTAHGELPASVRFAVIFPPTHGYFEGGTYFWMIFRWNYLWGGNYIIILGF